MQDLPDFRPQDSDALLIADNIPAQEAKQVEEEMKVEPIKLDFKQLEMPVIT